MRKITVSDIWTLHESSMMFHFFHKLIIFHFFHLPSSLHKYILGTNSGKEWKGNNRYRMSMYISHPAHKKGKYKHLMVQCLASFIGTFHCISPRYDEYQDQERWYGHTTVLWLVITGLWLADPVPDVCNISQHIALLRSIWHSPCQEQCTMAIAGCPPPSWWC